MNIDRLRGIVEMLTDSENQPHQWLDEPAAVVQMILPVFWKMVSKGLSASCLESSEEE